MKKFVNFFEDYIDISSFGDSMAKADIESLNVDKKNRRLKINLNFSEDVPEKELSEAKKLLLQSDLNLKEVIIIPSVPKVENEKNFKNIIQEFALSSPTLKRVFKDFEATKENEDIKIYLYHGGKDFLMQKNMNKKLSVFISQHISAPVNVIFIEKEIKKDNIDKKTSEPTVAAPPPPPKNPTEKKQEPEKINKDAFIEVRDKNNLLPKIIPGSSKLLYGNIIKKEPISIREISIDAGNVCVWGDIFSTDSHETRDGSKIIYTVYITDYTGSLILKIIENKNKSAYLEKLKKGQTILVYGEICDDKYERDIVMRPKNINTISKYKIVDNAPKKRVELHLHTNMSAMDGMTPAEKLIEKANEWGHPAVAITDHGVAQAYPEAMNTVKAINKDGGNFKVIYGVEAYFVNDMLPIVTGDDNRNFDDEYICFDLETTGFNAKSDKIIEIGAVRVKNNVIQDEFCTFVDPKIPVPERITEVTGITSDMVKGAPTEDIAIKNFIDFCKDSPVLVAHNANFDVSFIKAATKRLGIDFSFTYVDTVPMSRALIMSIKNHKLDTVAKFLKIPEFNHHRASDDARALAYILIELLKIASKNKNISTLQEINTSLAGNDAKKAISHHMSILVKNQNRAQEFIQINFNGAS